MHEVVEELRYLVFSLLFLPKGKKSHFLLLSCFVVLLDH